MTHSRPSVRRIITGVGVVAMMAGSNTVYGQKISGDSVLARIEQQMSGVKDFTVRLKIVADIERMDVPPMHATLYFKQPDKMHLESDGFAMLPREANMLTLGKLAEKFTATVEGEESIGGKKCYRLALTPRSARGFRGSLILLVDPARWTPERLETSGSGGRTVTANFEQVRVGDVWLTGKVTVRLQTGEQDSTSVSPPGFEDNPIRRQIPRNGTITITYSDYEVNHGLSDSIFVKDLPRN